MGSSPWQNGFIERYWKTLQGILGERPTHSYIKDDIKDFRSVKFEKIKHAHGLFHEFKIAA